MFLKISENFRDAIMGDGRGKDTEAWLGEAMLFCCCSYFCVACDLL
jgi:hypothetical protein